MLYDVNIFNHAEIYMYIYDTLNTTYYYKVDLTSVTLPKVNTENEVTLRINYLTHAHEYHYVMVSNGYTPHMIIEGITNTSDIYISGNYNNVNNQYSSTSVLSDIIDPLGIRCKYFFNEQIVVRDTYNDNNSVRRVTINEHGIQLGHTTQLVSIIPDDGSRKIDLNAASGNITATGVIHAKNIDHAPFVPIRLMLKLVTGFLPSISGTYWILTTDVIFESLPISGGKRIVSRIENSGLSYLTQDGNNETGVLLSRDAAYTNEDDYRGSSFTHTYDLNKCLVLANASNIDSSTVYIDSHSTIYVESYVKEMLTKYKSNPIFIKIEMSAPSVCNARFNYFDKSSSNTRINRSAYNIDNINLTLSEGTDTNLKYYLT